MNISSAYHILRQRPPSCPYICISVYMFALYETSYLSERLSLLWTTCFTIKAQNYEVRMVLFLLLSLNFTNMQKRCKWKVRLFDPPIVGASRVLFKGLDWWKDTRGILANVEICHINEEQSHPKCHSAALASLICTY